ncbi:CoA-binding protein [Ichthyenterobacterium sp. W332]|uniref:CoA-binding protein n=1 Tax=Microcosmobacter mediterraneus TaxID=3075607 RepID=A0ABU2YIH0_9FLAO|nr:CoA-binding protein [Ichthyenterobacterium sp. W332]MDT0557035.1 CoA-binding protein [Ichthyenterobacterium sp. W332]
MKKKTLVIGASLNPTRYSHLAVKRLIDFGHNVVAFGLRSGTIETVSIDTDLKVYTDINTVTLYVGPKHQDAYMDYIVSLIPKRVIFNPGTENPKFYKLLKEHDINFEEACTLVLLSTNQY